MFLGFDEHRKNGSTEGQQEMKEELSISKKALTIFLKLDLQTIFYLLLECLSRLLQKN